MLCAWVCSYVYAHDHIYLPVCLHEEARGQPHMSYSLSLLLIFETRPGTRWLIKANLRELSVCLLEVIGECLHARLLPGCCRSKPTSSCIGIKPTGSWVFSAVRVLHIYSLLSFNLLFIFKTHTQRNKEHHGGGCSRRRGGVRLHWGMRFRSYLCSLPCRKVLMGDEMSGGIAELVKGL